MSERSWAPGSVFAIVFLTTTLVSFILLIGLARATGPAALLRQEVNIIDSYLTAASGSYATSSAIVYIDPTKYSGTVTYYFEALASTSAATNATVTLVNASTGAIAASITINGTSNTLYRSSSFVPSTATEYAVRIGNEAVGKSVGAARVIITQNIAGTANSDATSTQTQIEIGSEVINASNTSNAALTNPKYWTYTSSKWDPVPTFYVDVTYQNPQVSSSTIYNTAGTFTGRFTTAAVSSLAVEAWGAGGGGGVVAGTGGGGGGGGAYAKSIFATTTPNNYTLTVGAGGASDTSTFNNSTFDTSVVVARGGSGTTGITGGTGGGSFLSAYNSTSTDGGTGGTGLTTNDTSGGGGGAAGVDGAGKVGEDAQTSIDGAGGDGDNSSGGAGGPQRASGAGNGNNGTSNALGGGGGGGAAGNNTTGTGGNGGVPGGGGGGSEDVGGAGSDGQVKLTETFGSVGIALQEDDGSFANWTYKMQVVYDTAASSTRARSPAFIPTDGRHYRLVASTTNVSATYSIYNAKIVIEQASYTTVILTSNTDGTCGSGCWTVPSDWNSTRNSIEVIGGGGGGFNPATGGGGGGGGGAYSRVINLSLTAAASITFGVGTAGTAGVSGGDTWFNAANFAACVSAATCVSAKGGTASTANAGGSGGAAGSGIGATKNSGGTGGTGQTTGADGGGGGGGAAGPTGDGGNGGTGNTGSNSPGGGGANGGTSALTVTSGPTDGGNNRLGVGHGVATLRADTAGGAGTDGGGGGGSTDNADGGAGSQDSIWVQTSNSATAGPGAGGGGGSGGGSGGVFGNGGQAGGYGGGGGGVGDDADGTSLGTGGSGTGGIIVISYVPSGDDLITLFEPQYQLAPSPLARGTSLQGLLTSFNPAEWSGVANTYLFDVDAADNSTSVITLTDSTGATTYATVTSPDNAASSALTCAPTSSTIWDTKATTNNNDIFGARVIAQVSIGGVGGTASCAGGGGGSAPARTIQLFKGFTLKINKGGSFIIYKE